MYVIYHGEKVSFNPNFVSGMLDLVKCFFFSVFIHMIVSLLTVSEFIDAHLFFSVKINLHFCDTLCSYSLLFIHLCLYVVFVFCGCWNRV